MEKLIVNNQEVDLFESKGNVSLNLQVNNLGDISTRNSSYSDSINLPRTSKNNQIFNFIGVNGNTSRAPYKKLQCSYFRDNVMLVRNGYLQILEVSNKHIKCNIYDGIVGLSERIKGKTLRDLKYNDINHYLNVSTYTNSFSNTEGFIYGIAEFGKGINAPIQIESQAPSIYVKTIWDKIFSEAGIRYSGEIFSKGDLLDEVITIQNGYTINNITPVENDLGTGQTSNIVRRESSTSYLTFSEKQRVVSNTYNSKFGVNGNGCIVSNYSGRVGLTFNVKYKQYETNLRVDIKQNDSIINSTILNNNLKNETVKLYVDVSNGDVISSTVYASSVIPDSGGVNSYHISFSLSSTIAISDFQGGNFINFKNIVSNISQEDFVKDVLQRHGLQISPSKVSKDEFVFIEIEKVLNQKDKAHDITSNLQTVNKEGFKLSYAINNKACYKYPKEITNRNYDGSFILDNENLKSEKKLWASPYEIPVKRSQKYFNEDAYIVPLWNKKDNVYENKETPVKIFRIKRVSESHAFKYFFSNDVITVTDNVPFLSLERMGMQYFLNKNYPSFRNLMNGYKELDASLYMNSIELGKVDLFRLMYLKQTGRYYYLQKLKTGKGSTKASLLELNEFAQNQPPTRLGTFTLSMGFRESRTIGITDITSNTQPSYFDPELDPPLKVLIVSGYNNPEVSIFNKGVQLTSQTEIITDNFDFKVTDNGKVANAHNAIIKFKIADEGSGIYSNLLGIINVNVSAYNNLPPIANAGRDRVMSISESNPATISDELSGYQSTDNTGSIVKYQWSITSRPTNSISFIEEDNQSTPEARFVVPFGRNNVGEYIIRLIVTDSFGLTDTDTVRYRVDLDRIDNGDDFR